MIWTIQTLITMTATIYLTVLQEMMIEKWIRIRMTRMIFHPNLTNAKWIKRMAKFSKNSLLNSKKAKFRSENRNKCKKCFWKWCNWSMECNKKLINCRQMESKTKIFLIWHITCQTWRKKMTREKKTPTKNRNYNRNKKNKKKRRWKAMTTTTTTTIKTVNKKKQKNKMAKKAKKRKIIIWKPVRASFQKTEKMMMKSRKWPQKICKICLKASWISQKKRKRKTIKNNKSAWELFTPIMQN